MAIFDPTELAEWTGGTWLGSGQPDKVCGFSFDSRKIQPGECFIALTTGQRDGHEYVAQAMRDGATAALVQRPLEVAIPQLIVADTLLAMESIASAVRSRFLGSVIGVTGSCGKTSTKEMLLHLLGPKETHATTGNWNNRIGVPMTLFGLHQSEKSTAVVEAGINQPGEMSHLARMIEANLVLVTHIGPSHLEKLGTLDGVAAEKSILMQFARESAQLVLTASAYAHEAFASFADRTTVLAETGEVVRGRPNRIVRYDTEGGAIRIKELFGEMRFKVMTHSSGIRRNAALSLVAASLFGASAEVLQKRLLQWSPSENRGRLVERGEQLCYLDCYNANPASMADALAAFSEAVPQDVARCYVLGVMNELGSEVKRLHTESVQALSLRAEDLVCLVGPAELRAAYRAGLQASEEQVLEADSAESFQSVVASFSGALFFKGSRSLALEQLIP
ncbi:MAG: UDP-N-acetylmuramoyl-tripeptide--D-alanyl-D-alanine ligase [Coraliomargaritaceae bacterium]